MALLTASAFSRWPTMAPDARRLEAQAPAILPLVALQLARVLASPGPGMRGRPRCAQAPLTFRTRIGGLASDAAATTATCGSSR